MAKDLCDSLRQMHTWRFNSVFALLNPHVWGLQKCGEKLYCQMNHPSPCSPIRGWVHVWYTPTVQAQMLGHYSTVDGSGSSVTLWRAFLSWWEYSLLGWHRSLNGLMRMKTIWIMCYSHRNLSPTELLKILECHIRKCSPSPSLKEYLLRMKNAVHVSSSPTP